MYQSALEFLVYLRIALGFSPWLPPSESGGYSFALPSQVSVLSESKPRILDVLASSLATGLHAQPFIL